MSIASAGAVMLIEGLVLAVVALAAATPATIGRRFDPTAVLAAVAVAAGSARWLSADQGDRLLDGAALLPFVAVAGIALHLVTTDRPRAATASVRNVAVPFALLVVGEALGDAARGRSVLGGRPGPALEAADRLGGLHWSNKLVVSWVELAVVALLVATAGGFVLLTRRGKVGRWLRVAGETPDLLALAGIDAGRLRLRIAGLAALAGGIAGVASAATLDPPAPSALQLGLVVGEVLVIGGIRPSRQFGAALLLAVVRSLVERAAPGWGPLGGHLLTLAVAVARMGDGRRFRDDAPLSVEEEALR